jgi:hypothetical protein
MKIIEYTYKIINKDGYWNGCSFWKGVGKTYSTLGAAKNVVNRIIRDNKIWPQHLKSIRIARYKLETMLEV